MGVRFHKFTDEQINWLKKNNILSRKDATQLFNQLFQTELIEQQIVNARKRHGLTTGRNGQFQSGNVPSPLAGAKRANSTSFKPGQEPVNKAQEGTERIRDGYIYVKFGGGKWLLKHRLYQDGEIVRFKDGNSQNISPDNLVSVTRTEHLILNITKYHQTPEIARNTHIATAKLKAKIIGVK